MSYVEDHMKESLGRHVLEEIPVVEGREPQARDLVRVFRMFRPGEGRTMSTMIYFLREVPGSYSSIVVKGDLCPRPHGLRGVISDMSYGIEWFSGKLSERYLCEKFMGHVWQSDAAAEWCDHEIAHLLKNKEEEELEDDEAESRIDRLREIKERLTDETHSLQFYDDLREISAYYVEDGVPGYDYPRADAAWLCAIQQKFSELYEAMCPAEPEPAAGS